MNLDRLWRRLLLTSFVVFLLVGAFASTAQETSEQIWLDYAGSGNLSDISRFTFEIGLRKQLQDLGYTRLVLTPGVDFRVNKFKLAVGIGNFFTFYEQVSDHWEIRPYQSAAVIWPNHRVSLDHRLKLEERFDLNTATWDSKNSVRGRYRLRLRYRLAAFQKDQFWAVTANGELFYTFAGEESQQQEQSRFGLGVERTFKHGRRLRFEVTWQQQGFIYDAYKSPDVIYFRLRWLKKW